VSGCVAVVRMVAHDYEDSLYCFILIADLRPFLDPESLHNVSSSYLVPTVHAKLIDYHSINEDAERCSLQVTPIKILDIKNPGISFYDFFHNEKADLCRQCTLKKKSGTILNEDDDLCYKQT